jgi:hypothetical protein
MGLSSAPDFPYPGGSPGKEPADPVAGKPGHFAWSRWIKEFVKRLDRESVKKSGDTMTGPLVLENGTSVVQARTESGALVVSGPIVASSPTQPEHLATRQYVETRVPVFHEATLTAAADGWAPATGLKAGAVVYSVTDVSSTPTTTQLLLNPATNAVYLGANATRKIRFWYV